MVPKKFEFQGKDVAEAINKACRTLNVSQEDLDIEVLNTGSLGIFGLCRQKVRLRVSVKPAVAAARYQEPAPEETPQETRPAETEHAPREAVSPEVTVASPDDTETTEEGGDSEEEESGLSSETETVVEVSAESCDAVKEELGQLLDLMGFPSSISVKPEQGAVAVLIEGDHVEAIGADDGRVLDGLQYLLRKILSKKRSENIAVILDAGNFRANRLKDLDALARKLAEEVKSNGKTKSISSLNPSERRVVHVALQEDKDVRSRSVGDGLFKKVLIYRPGKGRSKPGGRRRRGGGGRGPAAGSAE